jgi:hypothetical protein
MIRGIYRRLGTILLFCLFACSTFAQAINWPASDDVEGLTRAPRSAVLDQTVFSDWQVFWSPALDGPALAFGPPVALAGRDPQDLLRAVTTATGCRSDFSLVRETPVPKMTRYYFREQRNGLPVLTGRADLVLNSRSELMRWSLRAHDRWPQRDGHYLSLETAARSLGASLQAGSWQTDTEKSFAAWFPDHAGHQLLPVYWIRLAGPLPEQRWEGIVDAVSGRPIMDWPGIQTDVIEGTISGPYWQPYDQSPVQTGVHPFETVRINNNAMVTDSVGNFSRESGSSATLQTTLTGPWVAVENGSGPAGSMSQTVQAPFAPVAWQWTTDEATRAELNLFHHVNFLHSWYKVLDPAYSALDYAMPAQANYGQMYDNAFWNGWGIYFGSGGIYSNFGMFSDIIYHEYTHGVTDGIYPNGMLPYTGQPGAMNEGWSDYCGCTINNDPYEAEYIQNGQFNSYFRNLLSTMVYPANWNGEVHYDSPFISAPLWQIRTTLGAVYADSLWHFSRYALSETFFDYLVAVLEADDNDGNLSNGTPHSAVIYNAFGVHGIGPGDLPHFAFRNRNYYANGTGGSVGDGDRFYEQGETLELVLDVVNDAQLYPPPASGVQITVTTDDPSTSVVNGSQTFAEIAAGQTVHLAPVRLHLDPAAADHWVRVQINLTSNGNAVSLQDSFEFSVGNPKILIVEDDPSTETESYVAKGLRLSNRIYDRFVTTGPLQTVPDSLLPRPGLLIWLSGNATGSVLTTPDQYQIQTYLDAGNRVILSGQSLTQSLSGGPFMQNVLQVSLRSDSFVSWAVSANHAPFHTGDWFLISGAGGAGNQTHETAFNVLGNSIGIATYGRSGTGPVSAVQFANGRGLLFGFGIEAISGIGTGALSLAAFYDRIAAWASDVITDADIPEPATVLPTLIALNPAFPNPFNGSTSLSYSIPTARGGRLIIYDLLGRVVDSRPLNAPTGTINWTPELASGTYFAQIRWQDGQTNPVKLHLIR